MSSQSPVPIEHGTEQGYTLHRRRGVPMCDPCRLANNAAALERQREKKQRAAREREEALVKSRILSRMALAYPQAFERIKTDELRRRALERSGRDADRAATATGW